MLQRALRRCAMAHPAELARRRDRGRIVDNPVVPPDSRGQNPLRALTCAGDHPVSPKGP
jgi:hypothetical protein